MSSGFTTKTIDLGEISPAVRQVVKFHYRQDMTIHSVVSSCGCGTPYDRKNRHYLEVIYTPAAIPIHLLQQGMTRQPIAKMITVKYTCNALQPGVEITDQLFIKATIKKI